VSQLGLTFFPPGAAALINTLDSIMQPIIVFRPAWRAFMTPSRWRFQSK
jgi:hypothetical protein